MPYGDEFLEYDLYDEDWEEGISKFYDFNLLDLLEEAGDTLILADRTSYEIENNPVCLKYFEALKDKAVDETN